MAFATDMQIWAVTLDFPISSDWEVVVWPQNSVLSWVHEKSLLVICSALSCKVEMKNPKLFTCHRWNYKPIYIDQIILSY